jgi:hypothetical protein
MWTECGLHKKTRNALCYGLLTWACRLPRERFGKHLHHQSPISMALKPAGRPLWANYPAIVNLVWKPVEVYGRSDRTWALEFRVRIEVFGGMNTHFSISFHPWWFAVSVVNYCKLIQMQSAYGMISRHCINIGICIGNAAPAASVKVL